MRLPARLLNVSFIKPLKLTAYYQVPKRNMQTMEARCEAATRRADQTIEKLSQTTK